ncbi:MAG: ATP-binding protein [Bacteroidia bacterium]|nr:ATP-binding protein [Bacteroidia bacterium]
MENPFVTNGYAGPEYFCDRVQETADITDLLTNGNNLALISPRRYGKTDLLRHCFAQDSIKTKYYTFIVDIYATKSLADMVNKLGKSILDELKPKGKRSWAAFLNMLSSVRAGVEYDMMGQPSWNLSLGQIKNPSNTLDEIFHYLQNADRPCLVAIDEFQQILKYDDTNVEATLRTYMQYCSNANFVFSGSRRHLMGGIFSSPSRPFYQSVTIVNLHPIAKQKYIEFCVSNFEKANKTIDNEVVEQLYDRFEGATFYMQKVMNVLFMKTKKKGHCAISDLEPAINYIVDFTAPTYEDLMYQLPDKQCQVLKAISMDVNAKQITSGDFAKRHGIISASSVSSAVKALLDKDLITNNKGVYQVYDKFFDIWIRNYSE